MLPLGSACAVFTSDCVPCIRTRFCYRGHFDNAPAGVIFVFGDRHEHVAIGKNEAVASLRGIFPDDLAIPGEDRGFPRRR